MKKLVLALLIAHILPLFARSQNVIKNQAILSKAGSVKSPFEAYLSKNGENYRKFLGTNIQLRAADKLYCWCRVSLLETLAPPYPSLR